jgi:Chaperone of endosialidase
MKTKIVNVPFVLLALSGFVLLPIAQAVTPAPDGGYSGENTAEGENALLNLTTGTNNTAIGWSSLKSTNTTGYNTAVGSGALSANTATGNTAAGAAALFKNTTGASNTATGFTALYSNTTGGGNTATGSDALSSNNIGGGNTANGDEALPNNTSGSNTAVGASALLHNMAGNNNTADGVNALDNNTSGNSNVALGFGAGENVSTANNVICIGASIPGSNTSNTCYIGNIFGKTSSGGINVLVNTDGKLGTVPSSRRFKNDIKPMAHASEVLYVLTPVTFRYKKEIDAGGTSQFGLLAEDVEKIDPDLVVRDRNGSPYSVRYDQVNAMLLNEFLKEHKAFLEEQRMVKKQEHNIQTDETTIAELKSIVARQQKQVEALTAGLQRVSAQLELRKSPPRTVCLPAIALREDRNDQ